MNNYLITIFKQDDSVEYHTLTYSSLSEATNGACKLLGILQQLDSAYDQAGTWISEIK